MSRYEFTKTKQDKKLFFRVLSPTLYPSIPTMDTDVYVYPKEGERLETIAHKYYQDTSLWWIIARANDMGDGKMTLDPLKQIRVPTDTEPILQQLERLNTEI
jgi:hypothetical protein|tara:strand:- start:3298 stop:3603 length:306 start_codon:yes stop_codon:yes gene_type:complete